MQYFGNMMNNSAALDVFAEIMEVVKYSLPDILSATHWICLYGMEQNIAKLLDHANIEKPKFKNNIV